MSETDLKACPFCGGKATVYKAFPQYEYPWHISGDHDDACILKVAHTQFECHRTAAEAVAEWNRRSPAETIKPTTVKFGDMPSYGQATGNDLLAAVHEAIYGVGEVKFYDIDADRPLGHQMVPAINFNSLNRIVTAFVNGSSRTPVTVGARQATIRPLEWTSEDNGEVIAQSQVGWYHIGRPASYWCVSTPPGHLLSGFETLEAAKSAAQAHFEAAIRSALVEPASPVQAASEPVGWTGSGTLSALTGGMSGYIYPSAADAHPIPLYESVPPSDRADLERMREALRLIVAAETSSANSTVKRMTGIARAALSEQKGEGK